MFFVWFDGDRRRGSHLKLTDAIKAYVAKFGSEPEVCLTSHQDARKILSSARRPLIDIQSADFISKNTYYLGVAAAMDRLPADRPEAA